MAPTTTRTDFQLHLGDCLAGMRNLPADSIDLVVTSPPYNLGIVYGEYKDEMPGELYLDWCAQWAEEVRRVLKPDGVFYLNVGAAPSNPLQPYQLLVRLAHEEKLFTLQNTFHWIKSITIETRDGEEISAGHFKPINSKRYVNDCHEFVFQFTKSGDVPLDRRAIGVAYVHKSNIGRWGHTGGNDRRCRGNAWFVPYQTIQRRDSERPHPATFPIDLATKCIRLLGRNPKELTVMDPFLGIGHAALAALQEGVGQFVGFEIDAGYLNEAQARITEAAQRPMPGEEEWELFPR